jgi:biopolymer transport protein ExbD
MERPDLTAVDPELLAYIEYLESQIEQFQEESAASGSRSSAPPLEPQEPPTTQNLITISRSGKAKRTPRHFYDRQRRGGMGIFDLETPEEVSVTLPFSSSEIKVPESNVITLVVTGEGRTFIEDAKGVTAEVPREGLVAAVKDARQRRPGAFIVLKGDKGAKFGDVSDVMDAFVEANALRFNLMTELKTKR